MAPVPMALHVSYMQSLCKNEWCIGRQMILSAVRHGVAEEFIRFYADRRVNKRLRKTLDLTKPSQLSIADHRALQFRKLWRSIVRRDIVVRVDNWWHAQFRADSAKPNVCLDVAAMAVLHTTPLCLFLGHLSLHDLVD